MLCTFHHPNDANGNSFHPSPEILFYDLTHAFGLGIIHLLLMVLQLSSRGAMVKPDAGLTFACRSELGSRVARRSASSSLVDRLIRSSSLGSLVARRSAQFVARRSVRAALGARLARRSSLGSVACGSLTRAPHSSLAVRLARRSPRSSLLHRLTPRSSLVSLLAAPSPPSELLGRRAPCSALPELLAPRSVRPEDKQVGLTHSFPGAETLGGRGKGEGSLGHISNN